VAATLKPVLAEIAGLPGAPVRISQAAATYEQGPGNSMVIGLAGKQLLDGEYRTLLPDQSNAGPMTVSQLAGQVKVTAGPAIVASFVGDGPGASQAQQAVAAGLSKDAGLPAGIDYVGPPSPRGRHVHNSCVSRSAACAAHGTGRPAASSALAAATRRFAALPLATRRAWLAQHLTALRAGQIPLEQLP
jgi:hypothetical protein